MKSYLKFIAGTLFVYLLISTTAVAGTNTRLVINDEVTQLPASLAIKDEYIPLRWIAQKMGASKVIWEDHTVTVEIPDYLTRQQYIRYLNGLKLVNENHYPLPERLRELNFPEVEFKGYDYAEDITQKPVTINIISNDFEMPWTMYDYQLVNGTLFVHHRWLNTLFLADTKYDAKANTLEVSYITPQELKIIMKELEEKLAPVNPEEALALWIKGQQARNGALQYAALSLELKEKAMTVIKDRGWVTGTSSPYLGKATLLETKQTDENTVQYVVTYDEMLSGSIFNTFKQTITVQRQNGEDTARWYITHIDNNNASYSVLPEEE